MFYVYLIQNDNGQLYIGFTNNLERRIAEHKSGKVITTSRLGFGKLLYYEAYFDEVLAILREKKLKQFGSSYTGLLKRLNLK